VWGDILNSCEKSVILTIAIPVYNGEETLRDTLDSIIEGLEDGVDIFISDNASSDSTYEIVNEYMNHCSSIHYHCNDVNIGPMKNYDYCVVNSPGKYVWLFGDDDKMSKGCISKILRVIRNNDNLGFISISADIYGENWKIKDKNPLGYLSDIYFNSVEEAFITLKDHIGLTPTIIVRKEMWVAEERIRKLTNDYWFHLRMILAICEVAPSYFVASPPVMFNQGTVRWNKNGLFVRIVIEYCELVMQLDEKKISSKYKIEALSRWHKNLWRHVLLAKKEGWKLNSNQVARLLKVFWRIPSFWIVSLPVFCIPVFLAKAAFFVKNFLRNDFNKY